jgi:hypothetical protein
MPESYADTLAKFAAGRTATVTRLRALAGRLEELQLDAAAEVLVYSSRPWPGRGRK